MTDKFIKVEHDGLTFRCRMDGPGGNAPWIVFSNSLVTDLTVWDAQVEVLKDRYNLLRYDQRGHGGTSVPPGPCSFDQLGGDAIALLDGFGITTCTFAGLSMGVTTGLYLARHCPERIERFVFSDGQAATAPGGADTWQERIDNARSVGMRELARTTMERWFTPEFLASGKGGKAEAAAAAVPLEGYIACARALQGYDFTDVLARIRVPTLLMAGANDGNMPVSMRRMAEAIPGAVFHVIPDAGHIPNYERPETFNRHLLDFLR